MCKMISGAKLSDSQDGETPPVKRRRLRPQTDVQTDVHWLSESGVIDCTILLGPAPRQLFQQYAQLTGAQVVANLLEHFALLKHFL